MRKRRPISRVSSVHTVSPEMYGLPRLGPGHDETDDVAEQCFDARRPVAARDGRHTYGSLGNRDRHARPGRELVHVAAEPMRAAHRREYVRHAAEEHTTARIEIVGMFVVAQKHEIDRSDRIDADRGAACFL